MKQLKYPNLEQAVSSVVAALVAMALTGCPAPATAPEEDAASHAGHDHSDAHEHATTLTGAYEELEQMVAKVKSALEGDSPKDADATIHEVGHVIVSLPALAEKAGVESADEVKQATDDLLEGFDKLDRFMHGGPEVAWSDVSEKIDAAMEKLESWLPADAHAGHDHDGADHDGEDHADHDHDGEGHDH